MTREAPAVSGQACLTYSGSSVSPRLRGRLAVSACCLRGTAHSWAELRALETKPTEMRRGRR